LGGRRGLTSLGLAERFVRSYTYREMLPALEASVAALFEARSYF